MRVNKKCNNPTGVNGIFCSLQDSDSSEGAEYENQQHYIEFYQLHLAQMLKTPILTVRPNNFPTCVVLLHGNVVIGPRHEISNNLVCATSKASGQPGHTHSLIRAFANPLNIL